jgi:HSP90 family molecular chaperone
MEEFDGIPLENPEREKEKGRRSSQDMSNFNITQRDFSQISRWFKKVIGDRLEKISLSTRLKSTPAIATCTNWGYTASHERLIRAQTVHDQRLTDSIMLNRKILELNPEHPVIIELFNRVKTRPDDVDVMEDALLLYDTALVAGGFTIDGVLNYTKRIFRMLGRAHNLEGEIENFEIENAIDYQTIDDEFNVPEKSSSPPKITVLPPPKIPKDVEPIRVPRQSEKTSGENNDDNNENE